MCVVSMVSGHYDEKWDEWKKIIPSSPLYPPIDSGVIAGGIGQQPLSVSRTEFENLRKEVQEMKELLTKALAYDRMTNQANCSNEEKLDRLEKIAKFAGIDCDDLFKELRSIHAKKPTRRKRTTRVKK